MKDVIAAFDKKNKEITAAVKQVINESGVELQAEARRRCAVNKGGLRASIMLKFKKSGYIAEVGTSSPIAAYLEFGTGLYGPKKKKYVIVPVVARVLHWTMKVVKQITRGKRKGMGQIATQHVFAMRVEHPGIKPKPFLFAAWNSMQKKVMERLKAAVRGKL